MVFFVIALALAIFYAVLKPLGDGLLDTSMWVAKIMAPSDIVESDSSKQFLKFGQAALMEGWLSNVPLIATIFLFSSVIVAFFYHWWAVIVMLFVAITLGVFTNLLWGRSVSYYISFLHHKLVHRAANYKRDNDVERSEAAESLLHDLERIISIYHGSRLRPPTPKQLKDIPYGDIRHWLDRHAGGA